MTENASSLPAPITVLPHAKGDRTDHLLVIAAKRLRANGTPIAGVVQHARPGQAACCSDFYLEELMSGRPFEISQQLGREARGCRLDYEGLACVHAAVEESLNQGAEALILNRFGYSESQGGGLRPLIEIAVSRGIPVLIAVNTSYRAEWLAFCGTFACDINADRDNVMAWVRRVRGSIEEREGQYGCAQVTHSVA